MKRTECVAMAELKAVQSRLTASLGAVGYSKSVGVLPASLQQSEKLRRFVDAVAEGTRPDNYLNPEQAKKYVFKRIECIL